jgi:hypothetical protein
MKKIMVVRLSENIRKSIGRYILIRRFRRLRNKVLPFAEARGLFVDDDFF